MKKLPLNLPPPLKIAVANWWGDEEVKEFKKNILYFILSPVPYNNLTLPTKKEGKTLGVSDPNKTKNKHKGQRTDTKRMGN
ncbi:hypothetical protein HpBGD27_15190 [Helicobacter pylori]|uniref:hypothetical protein n=1 Tax=Helicobacter pylori TaxID=210 RepID=UPI0036F36B5E